MPDSLHFVSEGSGGYDSLIIQMFIEYITYHKLRVYVTNITHVVSMPFRPRPRRPPPLRVKRRLDSRPCEAPALLHRWST